ncbi:MAG: hypothetical protein ACLPTZ_17255 [Beijerinckiaceae bacterium]|jgi:hypothetical protein
MTKDELAEKLRVTKSAILAIHGHEAKALRRRPYPKELVAAAKAWARKLLDAVEVYPGPSGLPRRWAIAEGTAGPQIYFPEIAVAQSIIEIIAEINDPIGVVMAFRERYPVEFAGIRYLPQFVRAVEAKCGKFYYFYRRPGFEARLPDSPIGPEFMAAYNAARARLSSPRPLALAA